MAKHREKEFAFQWWDMQWPQIMCRWQKDPGFPRNEQQLSEYLGINEQTRQSWKKEWQKQSEEAIAKADAETHQPFTDGNSIDPADMTDEEMLRW